MIFEKFELPFWVFFKKLFKFMSQIISLIHVKPSDGGNLVHALYNNCKKQEELNNVKNVLVKIKQIMNGIIEKLSNNKNTKKLFRNIIEDFAEKHKELKSNLNELSINNNYEVEFISHYCENYSFN